MVHQLLNYTYEKGDSARCVEQLYYGAMATRALLRRKPVFDLSEVLDALSDPTRRQILVHLAEKDFCCGSFDSLGSKTRLTYHFNRLRQAGLIQSRRDGRYLILTLRRTEVDQAYPGLLQSVLTATENESLT